MVDVFPPSNLPPQSVPWGREVERAIKSNANEIAKLGSSAQNENRTSAGQMGLISRQMEALQQSIDELDSRITRQYSGGSLTVTAVGNSSSNPVIGNASKTVRLDGVGDTTRKALITVTSPTSANSDFIVELSVGGSSRFRGRVAEGTSSNLGLTSLSTAFSADIPPGGANLTISSTNITYGTLTLTGTLTNIQVSVFFVDAS